MTSSGRGEAVYVYVLGTNLSTGRLGYVNAGGTFTAWPAGSNPPSAAPDRLAPATAAAHGLIRELADVLGDDRPLGADVERVAAGALATGELNRRARPAD